MHSILAEQCELVCVLAYSRNYLHVTDESSELCGDVTEQTCSGRVEQGVQSGTNEQTEGDI